MNELVKITTVHLGAKTISWVEKPLEEGDKFTIKKGTLFSREKQFTPLKSGDWIISLMVREGVLEADRFTNEQVSDVIWQRDSDPTPNESAVAMSKGDIGIWGVDVSETKIGPLVFRTMIRYIVDSH